MDGRTELHVRVKGIPCLRLPDSKPYELQDTYLTATHGNVRHRTRLIEQTVSPAWNEEFVFEVPASSSGSGGSNTVVKFEVYSQGLVSDELLSYGYLQLNASIPTTSNSSSSSTTTQDASSLMRSKQQQQQLAPTRSHQAAGAAAASALGQQQQQQQQIGSGFSSQVQSHELGLLPGADTSGFLGIASWGSTANDGKHSRKRRHSKLKHSTHVSSCGVLQVQSWWVQQPCYCNEDTPPLVLSFVHPAGQPHPLPSATHTPVASLWEEPAIAFIRLVVSTVNLGHATAVTAATAGPSGSSGSRAAGRAVLQYVAMLLKADAEVAEDQTPAHCSAGWDWQALDASDDESDEDFDLSDIDYQESLTLAASLQRGSGGMSGVRGVSGADGIESKSDVDESVSFSSRQEGSTAGMQPQQQKMPQQQQRALWPKRAAGAKRQKKQSRKRSSQLDNMLHVTVKFQLGDQPLQILKPVLLGPDGTAAVAQSAVFAVTRPLEEALVTYELGLGIGPNEPPLLNLMFQYSLMHLLKRSPGQPLTWQEWRQVVRCTCSGLQVPLPCLPGSYLDLAAFVADADCRAGMCCLPPMAHTAVAASTTDAAAAAAAASMAAGDAAEQAGGITTVSSAASSGQDSRSTDDRLSTAVADLSKQISTASSTSSSLPSTHSAVTKGVLRKRPAVAGQQHQHQQHHCQQPEHALAITAANRPPSGFDRLKRRAAARVDKLLAGVEDSLSQAADRLPPQVAHQVKGRLISKMVPWAARSAMFTIGQLRVPSKHNRYTAAEEEWQQQQQLAQALLTAPSSVAEGFELLQSPLQQQQQHREGGSTDDGSAVLVGGNGDLQTLMNTASAANSSAVATATTAPHMCCHPNVATAGSPASQPLGVLKIIVQGISLHSKSHNQQQNPASGLRLLLRCGPHWLQLVPAAVPVVYFSAGGDSSTGSSSSSSNMVTPVQVLIPVYSSSLLMSIVLHKRSHVAGRCVFKLYGLLPLLVRKHTKSLTLYSDRRGSSGQRIVAGSLLLSLSAGPPTGYSLPGAIFRLGYSYLITPYTLEMHTSGVLGTMSRDERETAAGELVAEWLAGSDQGKHALPKSLVEQLVSTGRSHVSGSRMRGHVRRIKAVVLDWLPRRIDPLAFYYWKHPLVNLLVLWILSHACLYPAKWLLLMTILWCLIMLRRIAIQMRNGVLGFELEQLPPDMAEAAGVTATSSHARTSAQDSELQSVLASELGEAQSELAEIQSGVLCGSSERGDMLLSEAPVAAAVRSGAAHIADKLQYSEAAERLRAKLAKGKQKIQQSARQAGLASPKGGSSTVAAAAGCPKSLQELRDQLESGTLNLDSIDVEAAVQQLLSVGGLLKLARHHSTSLMDYALTAQNILDDAAGFAERLYAMLTAQDPLAGLLFCGIVLSSAVFFYVFGVGASVFVGICVLLRPPVLRGVPGVFGWKALLANLPSRSAEEMVW